MAVTATQRGQQAREKLLAAAAELIPRMGWHAVTTRAVAKHAGVVPGLVHYHFGSVDQLLQQAALREVERGLAQVGPVLEQADTVEAGLDALLVMLDDYTGSDPTSLLFAEAFLVATRDDAMRERLSALVLQFREQVAGWLEDHGERDAGATAAVLAAAIDGLLLHRALDPDLTSTVAAPVLRRMLSATAGAGTTGGSGPNIQGRSRQ